MATAGRAFGPEPCCARYNILMMKLQSTRFEVLSDRVLSCALGRKPYLVVEHWLKIWKWPNFPIKHRYLMLLLMVTLLSDVKNQNCGGTIKFGSHQRCSLPVKTPSVNRALEGETVAVYWVILMLMRSMSDGRTNGHRQLHCLTTHLHLAVFI